MVKKKFNRHSSQERVTIPTFLSREDQDAILSGTSESLLPLSVEQKAKLESLAKEFGMTPVWKKEVYPGKDRDRKG